MDLERYKEAELAADAGIAVQVRMGAASDFARGWYLQVPACSQGRRGTLRPGLTPVFVFELAGRCLTAHACTVNLSLIFPTCGLSVRGICTCGPPIALPGFSKPTVVFG